MAARNETIFKWVLYLCAAFALFLLQGFLLQYLTIFGAMPFLYLVPVALLAMFEGPLSGSLYGLVLGVLFDLTIAGPIPCFYTLILPLAGLCAGLISQNLLPAGLLCSLVDTVAVFVMTDVFHCLVLALAGKAAWTAGALTALRETGATLPFVLLAYPLFRTVFRRCHRDDPHPVL